MELLDLDNPGALNPADIGQVALNSVAQAREARKASQTDAHNKENAA
jgi:hypothetical protein